MASDSILGQISIYSFDYAPRFWAPCNGQLIDIRANQALHSIIGTKFGGDGISKFALPDLRGRVPIHASKENAVGQAGGEERHCLTIPEMPKHGHSVYGSESVADQVNPENNFWAANNGQSPYSNQPNTLMAENAISSSGGNHPHENMPPFFALNFCICTDGPYKDSQGTLGEIVLYAGDAAPNDNWMLCDGRLLSIRDNSNLFTILGFRYGGDGRTTFAVPNLQRSAPIQCGQGAGLSERPLAQSGGSQQVTLLRNQMPTHDHQAVAATAAGATNDPTGAVWAAGGQVRGGVPFYGNTGTEISFHENALSITGQELPHNNMPPYLSLNFLIAVQGFRPDRPSQG